MYIYIILYVCVCVYIYNVLCMCIYTFCNTPPRNYQALSQAITSGQNTKKVHELEKELREVKAKSKERLVRIKKRGVRD